MTELKIKKKSSEIQVLLFVEKVREGVCLYYSRDCNTHTENIRSGAPKAFLSREMRSFFGVCIVFTLQRARTE